MTKRPNNDIEPARRLRRVLRDVLKQEPPHRTATLAADALAWLNEEEFSHYWVVTLYRRSGEWRYDLRVSLPGPTFETFLVASARPGDMDVINVHGWRTVIVDRAAENEAARAKMREWAMGSR